MDTNQTKNMVIIKDLPSNIVQEAYIVLKPHIKNKLINMNSHEKNKVPTYIVKEAESVINNYLSEIENNKRFRNIELEKIKKKYKYLRKICIGLGICFILNIIIQFYI